MSGIPGIVFLTGAPQGESTRTPITGFASPAGRAAYLAASTSLTPSATVSTYGTAYTFVPDNGYSGFFPTAIDLVTASVGSETLTFQTVATYSDASTTTWATLTATSSTTVNLTAANLLAALAGIDGRYLVSLAVNLKSSISSSTATLVANVLGLNLI